MIKTVNIGDVVVPAWLKEIRPLDEHMVSRFRQSLKSGTVLPPIDVEIMKPGPYSVVAGYHRLEAHRWKGGPQTIEVNVLSFKTQADRLLHVIKTNVEHGVAMPGIMRTKLRDALRKLGVTDSKIAAAFQVEEIEMAEWGTYRSVGKAGHVDVFKPGPYIPAGSVVSKADHAEHMDADIGVKIYVLADQLTRWLQKRWYDKSDAKTCQSLRTLRVELVRRGF